MCIVLFLRSFGRLKTKKKTSLGNLPAVHISSDVVHDERKIGRRGAGGVLPNLVLFPNNHIILGPFERRAKCIT